MIAILTTAGTALSNAKRKIKAVLFGKDDVREASESMPWGYDGNPINGVNGVYCNTTTVGSPVIVGYINNKQKAETGESRIFATNSSGTFKYNVWLRSDGTVLIGDSDTPASYTNFLTKFNELKTGFDLLRTEVNALVTSYNGHTHLYLPPPIPLAAIPTATPIPTGVPATATIDSSKATKIKTC